MRNSGADRKRSKSRGGASGRGSGVVVDGLDRQKSDAAFQVIVLGSTGGPREDNITGLLVRSTYADWAKGSIVAVDAGSHLASIIRILEEQLPPSSETIPPKGHESVLQDGPFAGLKVPHISAKANGLHIFRELVHSFLITHPHLDHLSGLGINTPALEYGREAKAIVALPNVIEAIKTHIFNDLIWPNLSDENEGVGFVTYRRLIEGGNPRLGSGEGRGYVSVCNGLLTKCWSVTHGKCKKSGIIGSGHQHSASFDGFPFGGPRRPSRTSDDQTYYGSMTNQVAVDDGYRMSSRPSMPATPAGAGAGGAAFTPVDPNFTGVESSAFFLRNETDGSEIIVFGDVEPDSVSINPRNYLVWEDAAHKFVCGSLKAIFIECSYDDSVRDSDLYGHLCPRHLVAELRTLALKVMAIRAHIAATTVAGAQSEGTSPTSPGMSMKKRKRTSDVLNRRDGVAISTAPPSPNFPPSSRNNNSGSSFPPPQPSHRSKSVSSRAPYPPSPSFFPDPQPPPVATTTTTDTIIPLPNNPLQNLKVYIIHVKDTMMDGPDIRDVIVGQLRELGDDVGLGCEFEVTRCGQAIWL